MLRVQWRWAAGTLCAGCVFDVCVCVPRLREREPRADVPLCARPPPPSSRGVAVPGDGAPHFPKKDWVTGQGVYGELKGGTVVKTSMLHARRCVVWWAAGRLTGPPPPPTSIRCLVTLHLGSHPTPLTLVPPPHPHSQAVITGLPRAPGLGSLLSLRGQSRTWGKMWACTALV